jgi:integrase
VSPVASREDRWLSKATGERTARFGRGKRYRVHYTDPAGAQRSRSFGRAVDADAFKATVEADLLRGTWIDPARGRITLRAQSAARLAGYHADSSRAEKIRQHLDLHILPVLGDYPLGELAQRPSLISQFLGGLPLSASSAEQVYIALSSILDAAVDDGLIGRNPARVPSVKRPHAAARKVTPWTAEQVAAARAAMPARWRAAVDCGAGLGLRGGEIFGAGPDELDFLRRMVHVRRQVKRQGGKLWFAAPKGGKERDVPLPGPVGIRLAAHIAEFPPALVTLPWHEPGNERRHGRPVTARLLFPARAGGAANASTVNTTIWRPARAAAGLDGGQAGGLHQLRHYFASALLAGGVDVKTLSEYLGHANAAITLSVYTHLMPSAEGRARKAIEDALAGPDQAPIFPEVAPDGGNRP